MPNVDFFTQTFFSVMSTIKNDKPQQLNPLLPGYAFDVFLVSGMTPIEKGGALDFMIDRPHGMKGYIINLTIQGRGKVFSGDNEFSVAPGDLLLFPPEAVHFYGRADDSDKWYHRWVYFRPKAYWADWLKWPHEVERVGRITLHDAQLIDEFDGLFVITSYSIHYTKLYEPRRMRSGAWVPLSRAGIQSQSSIQLQALWRTVASARDKCSILSYNFV